MVGDVVRWKNNLAIITLEGGTYELAKRGDNEEPGWTSSRIGQVLSPSSS